MYGYSIVHFTEVTMLAKRTRVILEHRYVNNFSGLDCAQRGLEDINMRMNVAPNLPGSSGNFYIIHQSYRMQIVRTPPRRCVNATCMDLMGVLSLSE